MDAVFFNVKRAHLAAERFCREILGRYRVTPARFDLLVAIGGGIGPSQVEVRKKLGVARSTLSEMVAAVERLGWIRRTRALDRRTWSLSLTRRGKALLKWAYRWINRGIVPITIDSTLTTGEPLIDSAERRFQLIESLESLDVAFGRDPPFDLYMWHPDDYIGALEFFGEGD